MPKHYHQEDRREVAAENKVARDKRTDREQLTKLTSQVTGISKKEVHRLMSKLAAIAKKKGKTK